MTNDFCELTTSLLTAVEFIQSKGISAGVASHSIFFPVIVDLTRLLLRLSLFLLLTDADSSQVSHVCGVSF